MDAQQYIFSNDGCAEMGKITGMDGNLALIVLDRMPIGSISLGIDGLG